MSNIYDSVNEPSRGLRELPEYKVKLRQPKMLSKLMNKLARFLQTISAFQQEIQVMAQTGQMPDAFPRKDAIF